MELKPDTLYHDYLDVTDAYRFGTLSWWLDIKL